MSQEPQPIPGVVDATGPSNSAPNPVAQAASAPAAADGAIPVGPSHGAAAAAGFSAAPVMRPSRTLGLLAGGLMLAGGVPLLAALLVERNQAGLTLPGLRLGGMGGPAAPVADRGGAVGGLRFSELPARVHPIAEAQLSRRVTLVLAGEKTTAAWRDLGLVIDEAACVAQLARMGHSGDAAADLWTYLQSKRGGPVVPLPVELDGRKASDFLMGLKDQLDRAPADARLDLEKHTVAPERQGILLSVYDAMVLLQYAVRELAGGHAVDTIDLTAAAKTAQPQVRREDLKNIDVSTVLGSWETRYSNASVDSDRTYNLKVGASKLNGHMLRPHELFSFNAVVGDRTEKEGYRVAPVISGGELIDGLAGGMCQIASTLHAAAFFAGLEIVRSTPHSRPSTYIPMGLDSTVVYPSVDLKLRNPYDFPIVLHYVVNQGSVKVELLGKELPHHVAFEREILAETAFPTTTRVDPEMPAGQKIVDQDGYPGYRIKRRRYVFDGKWKLDPKNENRPKPDVLVAKKEWDISYPATAQIVRVGSGPPNLKKKDPPPSHRIPPLPAWAKPMFYIVK